MEFTSVKKQQWSEIKEIYMEAFPKCERKPFFLLRQSIKRKKAVLAVAAEGNQLLGFTVFVVYYDRLSGSVIENTEQRNGKPDSGTYMRAVSG